MFYTINGKKKTNDKYCQFVHFGSILHYKKIPLFVKKKVELQKIIHRTLKLVFIKTQWFL